MTDYKDIGTSYSRQFRRPDDAGREAENEQRKADLEAHENLEPEEMPVAQWNAAFDEAVAKHAVEDASTNGGEAVDQAIAEVVTAAGARVQNSLLSKEERMAKLIGAELRGQVISGPDGTDVYLDAEEPADEETEALEQWLDSGEDEIVGVDVTGANVYRSDDGSLYSE